jgi:uncharacterized protein (DUF885 family)
MQVSRRAALSGGLATAALLAGCGKTAAPAPDLNAVLDTLATDILRESPEYATSLAVDEARAGGPYMARLSDYSREGLTRGVELVRASVATLDPIDPETLSETDRVSHAVVRTALQYGLDGAAFGYGTYGFGAPQPYVLTQLSGAYTYLPDFLDSQHPIKDRSTADAYLTRLGTIAAVMDQELDRLAEDSARGVVPPDFAIARAIAQLEGFAKIAPKDNVLVASMARRIGDAADVPEGERAAYAERAQAIVVDSLLPAYARQIDALKALASKATHDAGVWKLPEGEALYAAALRANTTTDMSAEEIHTMGVELVKSLSAEMDTILKGQGLTRGSVAERYQAISKRPDQLYPNTDAGRAQLLADLNTQVVDLQPLLEQNFGRLAKAALEIKRVPPFTEAGAPGGYYQSAALDGSRPGAYYINLRDTAEWPKFTLPTLTYHEGNPGHHWQVSILQEADSLPFIRSALLNFNAYAEGWALYSEQLADEMGVYGDNPLGRLGYLQSMAFRASRLVVDTGLHSKRWTREQAIRSMIDATGDQESSITTEIERYCVWPGQACGYMVGRQAINRIREGAKTKLGPKFDIKGFHDAVLTNGALPLSVLEGVVGRWADGIAAA